MPGYDLTRLKQSIRKNYTPEHPLSIVLEEKDIIHDKVELLSKIETWLRLSHK